MEFRQERHIGDILKERNIILKAADAASRAGFTQVPNFLLRSKKLSAGDKMTFAMLLSYASASIDAEPVNTAPVDFAIAIAKLAPSA